MTGKWLPAVPSPGETLAECIADALKVRRAVFVEEQGFPAATEQDALDAMSRHAMLYDGAEPIATGRLYWAEGDFHVGRICVLRAWRGQGCGDALMRLLLHKALEHNARAVVLSAQAQAMPFYARYGFLPEGAPYAEDGVPHQQMRADADALRALFDCKACAHRAACAQGKDIL